MLHHLKQYLKFILSSIIFWTIAFSIFITIRYFAIDGEQELGFNSSYKIGLASWAQLLFFLGILYGLFFGTIEYIFDRFLSKRLYLIVIIVIKFVVYLLFLIFSISFLSHFIELQMKLDLPNEGGWWRTSETFWLITGYFFMCSTLFLFFRMVGHKFGRGHLINTLIGRYRTPREQKKIFMFLDLKSSTTIAEELGHLKYSKLIQDCFYDLNKIVDRYNASIYQYVGDEAVLTWSYRNGIRRNNCIEIFFAFQLALMRRARYYRKKYNHVPQFKVGVHGGKLIVAEVGSIKKEIAFHGDVINTTARIQSLCNKFDKTFLISDELLKQIDLYSKYESSEIGELLLEGKQDPVKLHYIDRRRIKQN